MAKKGSRILVKIRSESGYCYYTERNKMTTTEKLKLMKYDPNVRKRVLFQEGSNKFK